FSTRVRERLGLRGTLVVSLLVTSLALGCMLFARLGTPYAVLFVTLAIGARSITSIRSAIGKPWSTCESKVA
ncbi:MAG: hypothetical protein ABI346_06935, partial [Candidatus Baltobacteraceae bacterium]